MLPSPEPAKFRLKKFSITNLAESEQKPTGLHA
jgi:hypothetical protein